MLRIGRVATEQQEQVAFIEWFSYAFPKVLIHSIPNGAHLAGDARMRAIKMDRLKAEGLVPGMPDLHVPAWRLYVEFKRTKGGRLSEEQKDVIPALEAAGARVIVAKGWEDALRQIERMLMAGEISCDLRRDAS